MSDAQDRYMNQHSTHTHPPIKTNTCPRERERERAHADVLEVGVGTEGGHDDLQRLTAHARVRAVEPR